MTNRFQKVYDILINAFFTGTLAKGTCTACAVGNIVTAAQNGKVIKVEDYFKSTIPTGNFVWSNIFYTANGEQKNYIDRYPKKCEELKKLTSYTAEELAEIEYTFETNTNIKFDYYHQHTEQKILEDQYNGLVAVFDVLMRLDNITEVEPQKKLREHPNLVLTA